MSCLGFLSSGVLSLHPVFDEMEQHRVNSAGGSVEICSCFLESMGRYSGRMAFDIRTFSSEIMVWVVLASSQFCLWPRSRILGEQIK